MNELLKLVKAMIKKMLLVSYLLLSWLKIIKPKVIVMVDGGICSQMHQYLLGCIFREKGYIVSYDLTWFKKWSKDMNGHYDRKFDLLKAFPTVKFNRAGKLERIIYQAYFDTRDYSQNLISDEDLFDIKPPRYLGGYYHTPKELWTTLFPKYFKVNTDMLDDENRKIYNEIERNSDSVAVHVRRGDLSVYSPVYGEPASMQYFHNAIQYMYKSVKNPVFYIFSDEPEYIKNEFVNKLPILNNNFKIMGINGSDKGYMDLFLISKCSHKITSKGSLAKIGALLGDSVKNIVVFVNDPKEYVWKENFVSQTVFL